LKKHQAAKSIKGVVGRSGTKIPIAPKRMLIHPKENKNRRRNLFLMIFIRS
jgi:hypothetical protein